MLFRLFKGDSTALLVLIPLLGILIWLKTFHGAWEFPPMAYDTFQMPLYVIVDRWMQHFPLLSRFMALVLVLVQAFLLVRMSSRFILTKERTYLPAAIYLFLVAGVPAVHTINPALLVGVMIAWGTEKILDAYKVQGIAYSIFEASFIFAVCGFIYPPSFLLIVCVWIALLILRPFVWREWVFTILGTLLPWVLYIGFRYVFFDDLGYQTEYLWTTISHDAGFFFYLSLPGMVYYGFVVLLILLSGYFVIQMFFRVKVQLRKFYLVFIWFGIVTTIVLLFFPGAGPEMLYILAIPAAILISYYMVNLERKWWGETVLVLFLLMIATIHLYAYLPQLRG